MTRSRTRRSSFVFSWMFLALLLARGAAYGVVPLGTPPAWRSIDMDYSTGGALLDLNGDGYLDLVTGNGNDMARQPIRVYFNLGGELDTVAAWSSADIGYHCHVDLGDYDGDGDLDLAVALLGDPGTPQRDKIYRNEGTGFTSLPVWISGDLDNSFDLAWGDFDGDGDLDLATACGESYTSVPQRSKVYRNDGGVITENSVWRTGPVDYTLDVAWGDVDGDGDLDLACGNEFGPNRIYRNHGSGLDSIPWWESADTRNTLQIDFGDVDGDGWLDLAVANNAQLGGVSNAGVYFNTGGTLSTSVGWSSGESRTYFSAVTLADCDHDGDLDLASGGWWEPVMVYENLDGSLETVASFSWKFANPTKGLVVESVVWGDLDNSGSTTVTGETMDGDGAAKVFYLDEAPLRSIGEIRVGGVPVPYGDYAYDLDKGWIALASAPPAGSANVEVDYVYSVGLDLVVTNWDPDDPNVGFSYEGISTSVAGGSPVRSSILLPNRPNPFNPSTIIPIRLGGPARVTVGVYDVAGRIVRTLHQGPASGDLDLLWDGTDGSFRPVASGVYFSRVEVDGSVETGRMVLVR
ncbi:MAG: FG-GAP-like repeat-containing protein [Candidatus Eisenbacteria bacterium]